MNKVKTIFVLEDSSKSNFGGGQAISLLVCKGLCHKYKILLFDTKLATRFHHKIQPFIYKKVGLFTIGKIKQDSAINFQLLLELIVFPFYLVLNYFIIKKQVKEQQVVKGEIVLYACTKKTLIYAWLVNKFLDIPYVFHAHSYENGKSILFKIKTPWYKNAHVILCISNFVQKGLLLPNTKLIYNPIEIPINVSPKKIGGKETIIIAAFASLIPQKGLEYLMLSHDYLPNDLKNKVVIRIYGDGDYKAQLKKLVKPSVQLMGFCEDPAIVYGKEVDIAVISSIILEAFGMATIESFRYGVPVIATNQGGPAEIVQDGFNGFLVPIKDPKAIANAITSLITNPTQYEYFSANALQASLKFSSDIFITNIDEAFMDALR